MQENDLNSKSKTRRIEILTVASALYMKYGYHGTTLEAIAAKLGITRAALYRYFSSKDELFFQCHEAAYGQFLTELGRLVQIENPRERLEKMIERHILLLLRDFPMFGPILQSLNSLPDEYRKTVIELRVKVEKIYEACIRQWREQEPGAIKDLEDAFIMKAILSTINAVPRWGKRENNPADVAKKMVSILIDGIKN